MKNSQNIQTGIASAIQRWRSLREVKQDSEFNALRNCLGKKRLIAFQGVSEWLPKPERGETPIHLRRAKY